MKKNKNKSGLKTIKLVIVLSALLFICAYYVSPEIKQAQFVNKKGLKINIEPSVHIFGHPFSLKVIGALPQESILIEAHSFDLRGILWTSKAVFKADENGIIDIALQAPVSGSYEGTDILGLLWSMTPENSEEKKPLSYHLDEINGLSVYFTATDSTSQSVSCRMRRLFHLPDEGLIRIPLEKDGLYGFLYTPVSGGPFPGIVILGGSNGGLYEWLAQSFASHGFAALTLAYFNYRDLPSELVEIPLEYIKNSVDWLKSQKNILSGRIGLVGGSKGGELALLLASIYNDYNAVVAWVPSAYVWQGVSMNMKPLSSWSLNGKDLPFITGVLRPDDIENYQKGTVDSVRHFYSLGLEQADSDVKENARIQVEKIKAPILLVSGTGDKTWPSEEFSDAIMDRLKKSNYPYEYKHIRYENAGHQVFLPYWITGQNRAMKGGTAKDEAHGSLVSWNETLAFLNRHLKK